VQILLFLRNFLSFIIMQLVFEDHPGKLATLHHLRNSKGMVVSISNFGATVTSIVTPDRLGNFSNVVLSLEDQQAYSENTAFIGATVGRYANRIAQSAATIDGTHFELTKNNGQHHLHGGHQGLHKIFWDVEHESPDCLILSCFSPDGDEGYPGNLSVRVTFRLTDDNALVISYEGTTDKTTLLNLTNHSYFNLTGNPSNSILNHILTLDASHYTPSGSDLIPTGEILPVENTVLDFTTPCALGSRIDTLEGGYDHNYVLRSEKSASAPVAVLHEPDSGRVLEVFTTKPGIQLYTGGSLDGTLTTACGTPLVPYSGVCLETQFFPNSPNTPNFPSAILRPNETYNHTTTYRFSVRD
jgi:aldose 1-epimerase